MLISRELISLKSVKLSVLSAGNTHGEVVVCLHGFPDNAEGFNAQIEFLSDHGYFVLAPDQRGYGLSDKPKRIHDYELPTLAQDIIDLLDHFNIKQAHLLTHDWGTAVAWYLVSYFPERFTSSFLMSGPHWSIFKKELLLNFKQFLRSWYVLFIQLPYLPEFFLKINSYKYFAALLNSGGRVETESLRLDWLKNESIPTMLNWYRAMRMMRTLTVIERIKVPITLVWGEKDPYLEVSMGKKSIALCETGKFLILKDVKHWPQHESPNELNHLIIKNL